MQNQQVCIFLVFSFVCIAIECSYSTIRTITINKYSKCTDEDKYPIYLEANLTRIASNKYSLNGEFKFNGSEQYSSPIQLHLDLKRCDINMNQCDNFETIVIKDICEMAFQKDMFWSDAVAHSHPKPKCPIVGPSYKVVNATIDFGYLSIWPIDGYTWIATFKIFRPIANVRHKKEGLFCMIFEINAMKNRQQRKKG